MPWALVAVVIGLQCHGARLPRSDLPVSQAGAPGLHPRRRLRVIREDSGLPWPDGQRCAPEPAPPPPPPPPAPPPPPTDYSPFSPGSPGVGISRRYECMRQIAAVLEEGPCPRSACTSCGASDPGWSSKLSVLKLEHVHTQRFKHPLICEQRNAPLRDQCLMWPLTLAAAAAGSSPGGWSIWIPARRSQ